MGTVLRRADSPLRLAYKRVITDTRHGLTYDGGRNAGLLQVMD